MSETKVNPNTAKLDEILAKLDWLAAKLDSLPKAPVAQFRAAMPAGDVPTLLPNYGRSKGAPIEGADLETLNFYVDRARQSVADPSKARWADKEKKLIAAIEAEIARQGGDGPPPPGDADAPPPSKETPF